MTPDEDKPDMSWKTRERLLRRSTVIGMFVLLGVILLTIHGCHR
jgi:hypothetical protein